MIKPIGCAVLALLVFGLWPAQAFAYEAKVIGVTDGDTLKVLQGKRQVKIRLYGIDCPEKSQAFGKRAKQFTATLVLGKTVSIDVRDTDRYGRSVAVVYVNGACLNEQLLRNGLAWVYRQYYSGTRWTSLEEAARRSRIGLWIDEKPKEPWKYRRSGKKRKR